MREINRIGLMVRGGDGQPIRNPLIGIARGVGGQPALLLGMEERWGEVLTQ